jgi:hypothetical protein
MFTLVPIMAITFMVVIGYWMYRRQRMAYFDEVCSPCYFSLVSILRAYFFQLPTTEPMAIHPPSPTLTTSPVQLIEIKARGRFGAVWKGQLKTETVAVKIFPLQVNLSKCLYANFRLIEFVVAFSGQAIMVGRTGSFQTASVGSRQHFAVHECREAW